MVISFLIPLINSYSCLSRANSEGVSLKKVGPSKVGLQSLSGSITPGVLISKCIKIKQSPPPLLGLCDSLV